jgi:hypothetical protein
MLTDHRVSRAQAGGQPVDMTVSVGRYTRSRGDERNHLNLRSLLNVLLECGYETCTLMQ